jgi:hypothetical protein
MCSCKSDRLVATEFLPNYTENGIPTQDCNEFSAVSARATHCTMTKLRGRYYVVQNRSLHFLRKEKGGGTLLKGKQYLNKSGAKSFRLQARSLFLFPPVICWPTYILRYQVRFLSPFTTLRWKCSNLPPQGILAPYLGESKNYKL